MVNYLKADFFKSNRDKLLKESKAEIIILAANGLIQQSMDQPYPFTQESNFYYLTGLNEPDLILVISKNKEYIIQPKRSKYQEIFDAHSEIKDLSKISKIRDIFSYQEGLKKLHKDLIRHKKVHTILAKKNALSIYGMSPLPFRNNLITQIRSIHQDIKLLDLAPSLAKLRMIKTKSEIRLISKSVQITKNAIDQLYDQTNLQKYKSTNDIARDIEYSFKLSGADGHSFRPVISRGQASAIIHYDKNDQKLKQGDFLLVDVGNKIQSYCSDITRTIPIGSVSSRHEEVYRCVKEVQLELIKALKPGMQFKELEDLTVDLIGDRLIRLKLIKEKNEKNIRTYYPHAVSHHLGIDVHDLADYSAPLAENMVITIEPGIYIKKEGIGVRIEDDVVIAKTKARVL